MMLFPSWKSGERFDFSLGWPAGKMINGAGLLGWMLRISCSLRVSQERVDTGTPLFCPVVVASKGSSLNHSA